MKERRERPPRPSLFLRFLGVVERLGNLLPHPATLFALFSVAIVVLSAVAAATGVAATHPGTGEPIRPVSLLTIEGLHRILGKMVYNFTSFAPLGTVLVAMLGIGLAESTGLIRAALKLMVTSAPRRLLTFLVVFSGVLSNMASEIGYVLLVPLAATIFLSVGRHPLAGVAAAFAGVSGGYSANLLLGTIDPLLAGISQEAARIIVPTYEVNPACNYYFMAASTFLIAFAGTWVTERWIVPRLGEYEPQDGGPSERDAACGMEGLSAAEKRGLRWALVAGLVFTGIVLWGAIPSGGFLRNPETAGLLDSPLLTSVVAFILLGALATAIAYGIGAGTIRNDNDVAKGMGKAIETLGTYIVLVFFAAQFVAYFNWSNLGLILAVKGADTLRASGLGDVPLMLAFVLLSASINLAIGSASAKWALMAPIFIPMFMLIGYTPEFVQAAYRIGDSSTNIISPMMSYFALIVALVQRYVPKAGIGTMISLMLPYTLVFLAVWALLLVAWILLGLPVGPGAGMYMPQA